MKLNRDQSPYPRVEDQIYSSYKGPRVESSNKSKSLQGKNLLDAISVDRRSPLETVTEMEASMLNIEQEYQEIEDEFKDLEERRTPTSNQKNDTYQKLPGKLKLGFGDSASQRGGNDTSSKLPSIAELKKRPFASNLD